MYPFVHIGSYAIQTYHICMLIGLLMGSLVFFHFSKPFGLPLKKIVPLYLILVVGAYQSCKLLYVGTRLHTLKTWDFASLSSVYGTGLVWYGAVIFTLIVVPLWCKVFKLSLRSCMDGIVLAAAIGQCWGRIGCFLAGCCYGRPTESAFGVVSPFVLRRAYRAIPIHPAQLYAAGLLFLLFVGLVLLARKRPFEGAVAGMYFLAYPILRIFVELFRDDHRMFLMDGALSFGQAISAALFCLGIMILYFSWMHQKRESSLKPVEASA